MNLKSFTLHACDHHHQRASLSLHSRALTYGSHTTKYLAPCLTRHHFINPSLEHHTINPTKTTPRTRSTADPSSSSAPAPQNHPPTTNWNILDAPGLALPRSKSPRNDPLPRLLRAVHLHVIAVLFPPLASTELLKRVCITLSMLFFIRIGHYIALPGIQLSKVLSSISMLPSHPITTASVDLAGGDLNGPASFTALLTGSFEIPGNIYLLGITPYMTSSLVLASLNIIPGIRRHFKELRDEGRPGREVINSYLAAVFGLFTVVQAYITSGLLIERALIATEGLNGGGLLLCRVHVAVTLMAGAVLSKFIVQTIDYWGIGDGTGVFIGTGIALNYIKYARESMWPALQALYSYFSTIASQTTTIAIGMSPPTMQILSYVLLKTYPLILNGAFVVAMYLSFIALVVCVQGIELRLPLTFFSARRSSSQAMHPVLHDLSGGVDAQSALEVQSLLPLRLSPSGTKQLLFANFWVSMLHAPLEFLGFDPLLLGNPFIFAGLVFILESVSIADATPKQISEFLSQSDIAIRGLSPGIETERFLSKRRAQMKFINAGFIALVSLAARAVDALSVQLIGVSFGCLMLLLLVSTVLGGARQVDALSEGVKIEKRLAEEYRFLEGLVIGDNATISVVKN